MNYEDSGFFRLRSVDALAKLLFTSADELEEILREGKKHYKQFAVEGRWIEAPRRECLKRIQKRISNLLSRITPPTYINSNYKGSTHIKNAVSHSSEANMIKLDLKAFFPSSNGMLVARMFLEKFECSNDIATILGKLCTISRTKNNEAIHLPTGAPSSPILAFLIYKDMFDTLYDQANRKSCVLTVYADDITISGEAADHLLLNEATEIILSFGLKVNYKKRACWGKSKPNKNVTGVILSKNGPRVPRERKEKLNQLFISLRRETCPQKRAKLYQQISGSLFSMGEIEDKYRRTGHFYIDKWRKDKQAWSAHQAMSASRKQNVQGALK